jgi:hypothetical protein
VRRRGFEAARAARHGDGDIRCAGMCERERV